MKFCCTILRPGQFRPPGKYRYVERINAFFVSEAVASWSQTAREWRNLGSATASVAAQNNDCVMKQMLWRSQQQQYCTAASPARNQHLCCCRCCCCCCCCCYCLFWRLRDVISMLTSMTLLARHARPCSAVNNKTGKQPEISTGLLI